MDQLFRAFASNDSFIIIKLFFSFLVLSPTVHSFVLLIGGSVFVPYVFNKNSFSKCVTKTRAKEKNVYDSQTHYYSSASSYTCDLFIYLLLQFFNIHSGVRVCESDVPSRFSINYIHLCASDDSFFCFVYIIIFSDTFGGVRRLVQLLVISFSFVWLNYGTRSGVQWDRCAHDLLFRIVFHFFFSRFHFLSVCVAASTETIYFLQPTTIKRQRVVVVAIFSNACRPFPLVFFNCCWFIWRFLNQWNYYSVFDWFTCRQMQICRVLIWAATTKTHHTKFERMSHQTERELK